MSDTPTIRHPLEELIQQALETPFVSRSCKDGVETGNHYQSLGLSSARTTGFRDSREVFLDKIAFHNRKVLDLGSNLGELSREARRRGASLVDGYELEPFFVEIGRAVNALIGTTRVSFFESDITNPASYVEHYDIVLAFSVFHYVASVLPSIARITRELLVVETHRLENNLEAHYIAPVRAHFPAYSVLGFSDWRADDPSGGERAVIAFAKDEQALASGLALPSRED